MDCNLDVIFSRLRLRALRMLKAFDIGFLFFASLSLPCQAQYAVRLTMGKYPHIDRYTSNTGERVH